MHCTANVTLDLHSLHITYHSQVVDIGTRADKTSVVEVLGIGSSLKYFYISFALSASYKVITWIAL